MIWSLKIQLQSSQKFKYLKNNSCAVANRWFFFPRLATSVSSRAVFSPILISIINFLLLTTYLSFFVWFWKYYIWNLVLQNKTKIHSHFRIRNFFHKLIFKYAMYFNITNFEYDLDSTFQFIPLSWIFLVHVTFLKQKLHWNQHWLTILPSQ